MTAQTLATNVLLRISTDDGFAHRLVHNSEDALRQAGLRESFALVEQTDAETTGIIQARGFTHGWHCYSNTKGFSC